MAIDILGIDNVFFNVGDLSQAREFYGNLGFKEKLLIERLQSVLYLIGNEEPGLGIRETSEPCHGKLWVEVKDATAVKKELEKIGIQGRLLEPPTGTTFEIQDPWGNIIGFADYCKIPNMARKA